MRTILAAFILLPVIAHADDDAFFKEKIRPLLADTCFQCHSHEANKSKGGLLLDSREAMLVGGDTGGAIVPGKPENSLLIEAIRYENEDLQMPPTKGDSKKLTDEQIGLLTEWVKRGAPWPAEHGGEKMVARAKGGITDEDRKWWAIQPIAKVQPPTIKGASSEVDAFVFQKLEAAGLQPAPAAAPEQLVRRISFDLIGLPPTPEQTFAFSKKAKTDLPSAVSALVDELLASPRYGERWARYWLDVARFADSDGYKIDHYRPTAWRYRDYVIRAFNDDKPYDRFVREQIAGDELYPSDADALTATGFLRAGIYEYNNRDVAGQWETILNELTDTTGDVFLGLGVQCARCHDHKFDPILQKDYYRLQAFFAPIRWMDDVPLASPEIQAEHAAKLKAWEEKTAALRAEIEPLEAKAREAGRQKATAMFPEDVQAIMAKEDRTPREIQLNDLAFRQVQYEWDNLLNQIKGQEKDALIKLQKKLSAFDADKPEPLPSTLTASDVGTAAPVIFIPKKQRLGEVAPGFPTIIEEAPAAISPTGKTTGRRSALAHWLTEPENPLTARVIVNRVWQHHFGRGLATNASDFGKLGDIPSHPELLDWLARRFIEDGWSIKKLHKRILTSAAYQQSATSPILANARLTDPENKLLWRYPTRRLDAEQVRDAILTTTGELDDTAAGSGSGTDKPRRTIFTKVVRNTRDSLLDVFDSPQGFQSTAQRDSTTTSMQALTLFNGKWILDRAHAFAKRVTKESSADPGERATAALRLAWGREPLPTEIASARSFLTAETALIDSRKPELKPIALDTEKMPFREGRGVKLIANESQSLSVKNSSTFPDDDFTIEAHILAKSIYPDGQVRTIASHWDGKKTTPGWSLGITGKGSRYKPGTLLLQLNGTGSPKTEPEPIFSGLIIDIERPYYVACTVNLADEKAGITFYLKDLSNDDLPLQAATVLHTTTGGIATDADFHIGTRGHGLTQNLWDGLIDDIRLSRGVLPAATLLINSAQSISDSTAGYWQFESDTGLYKDTSLRGNDIVAEIGQAKPGDPAAAALIDFCHVLLNSNEFLYLD